MTAFSEKSLFEQGQTGSFYATGSNAWIGEEPGTFVSPLRNKEQIRLSFPVRTKVKMLPNSSSIYYFNFDAGQWNIPSEAVGDHAGPSESFAVDTRYTVTTVVGDKTIVTQGGTSGSIFIEDEKWFDTYGNSLGSGSLNIFRTSSHLDRRQKMTDESFSEYYTLNYETWSKFLSFDLPKSVQRQRIYNVKKSEYFIPSIEEPFLIEKVVFEVPFCFGNGWFNDRTLLTLMTSSNGNYTLGGTPLSTLSNYELSPIHFKNGYATSNYNYGGPGLTLALFSEKNYGTGSIRDLVCRSFITHDEDSVRDARLTPIQDQSYAIDPLNVYDDVWIQLTTLGHDREETKIDAIVSASFVGSKKFFTGSVVSTADVEISNGVRIIHEREARGNYLGGEGPYSYSFVTYGQAMTFLSSALGDSYTPLQTSTLTGIDTFGRGMTGFSPSGGSIFGSEFVTAAVDVIRRDGSIKNPSRLSENRKRQILEEFDSTYVFSKKGDGSTYNIVVPSYYFIGSRRQSPYLINPGEKLSLAIVKNRPAMINFKANIPDLPSAVTGKFNLLSSSFYMDLGDPLGHDVQLNTGSINITLYGSYVREGRKYIP